MKTKILLLLLCCFTLTAGAWNPRRVEKEFRKRNAECVSEQHRVQKSNVKHYKHLPKWCRTNGKNLHK